MAVTLKAAGWQTQRLTVRPAGHPYSRRVELRARAVDEFKRALVLDEGPGISGTSMAATGLALREAGVEEVSIIPGHSGGPLSPSPEIRRWWQFTRSFFVPFQSLRWNGLSLQESLLIIWPGSGGERESRANAGLQHAGGARGGSRGTNH